MPDSGDNTEVVASLVARIDERTITMEKRLARLELAVIGVGVGAIVLISHLVLRGVQLM